MRSRPPASASTCPWCASACSWPRQRCAGGAVAFAGVIGFVGLVTPHLCRLVWGPAPRRLLVRSAVLGAALTVAGDTLARRVVPGAELPVGVVTAVLGVPFFVALLRRSA
ncbi:MAG: iron chelate uptake ABC transporter family permease subunit [Thermoanaerobaculaceae bacterium]